MIKCYCKNDKRLVSKFYIFKFLYTACSELTSEFFSSVDWLISQNVDIINMSGGFIGGTTVGMYGVIDRWIDAVTYMNDILFVVSSGNSEEAT